MKNKIYVTKSFLPPRLEFDQYIDQIWQNGQLTNQGPLLKDLEEKIEQRLAVNNLHFVSNGTIALQLALKVLDVIEGEVITTPFSYVATTSSILWERCSPVFVDIEPDTYCIDVDKIEAKITNRTKAIIAVHVFGFPCDVDKIEAIAKKHKLKVIYDAAHAFGVEYQGKSLLKYGDIATCSFHSTKLFHTIEGGCVVVKDDAVSKRLEIVKRFGHDGDVHKELGINAKGSEFQAAMGLCNLKYIDKLIEKRKIIFDLYTELLKDKFVTPRINTKEGNKHNYAYYPILFKSENHLKKCFKLLEANNVYPRRYFYPSLNNLPYLKDKQSCPISEDISSRIACLPLYDSLPQDDVREICRILLDSENV